MLPSCSYVARSKVRSEFFLSLVHAHPVLFMASSERARGVSFDQTYLIRGYVEASSRRPGPRDCVGPRSEIFLTGGKAVFAVIQGAQSKCGCVACIVNGVSLFHVENGMSPALHIAPSKEFCASWKRP
jgi:hypothetical protein